MLSLKLPLSCVFDATGMKKDEFRAAMKAQDKLIAIGVVPCQKAGHTMRTRSNNCIQCDRKTVGFLLRNAIPGHVYIAASRKNRFLKVGSTTYLERRETSLNEQRYGSADDWVLVAHGKFDAAQTVEYKMHNELREYLYPASYTRGGISEATYEIFRVPYALARKAFVSAYVENKGSLVWERKDALLNYDFAP